MGISEPHKYIHPVRAGSMVRTYADIAEQAFGGFLDDSLNSAATVGLSSLEAHRRFRDHDERRRLNGIKTVVFAAMAIEAAAFEFAATALGDFVARGDLDKMGLVRKWMTVTKRICGQPLDFKGPAIQGLKSLVKARNALVHYKSKPESDAGTVREAMMAEWTQFEKDQVPNAFRTLVLLSLELEASPCGIFGGFPYHDKSICPPGFTNDYSPRPGVKAVIDHCYDIHKKHLKGV